MTLKFKLDQDFCTMHQLTKFHYPMFNNPEVIVLTKHTYKQRDSVENIPLAPLRYVGGKNGIH